MSVRKFVKSSFSWLLTSGFTSFLRFYLSFLRSPRIFYATTTRSCDILPDCHIGGADKQKLFSDSYHCLRQNVETSHFCPPDASSSGSLSLVIASKNRYHCRLVLLVVFVWLHCRSNWQAKLIPTRIILLWSWCSSKQRKVLSIILCVSFGVARF